MIWGGGALDQHGWHACLALLARLVIALVVVLLMRRPLALFDAGTARGLSVSLARTPFAALGVIGFIGLAGPTVARLSGARRFGERRRGRR